VEALDGRPFASQNITKEIEPLEVAVGD